MPTFGDITGVISALPSLLSQLIPRNPLSAFSGAASLPPGTDLSLFGTGLPAGTLQPFIPDISLDPAQVPSIFGRFQKTIFADTGGVPLIQFPQTRGVVSQVLAGQPSGGFNVVTDPTIPATLGAQAVAAGQALSFDPRIAARGEAVLQSVRDAPLPVVTNRSPFPPLDLSPLLNTRESLRRAAQVEQSIETAGKLALLNPAFQLNTQAFGLGFLPGGEVSPALANLLEIPEVTLQRISANQAVLRNPETFSPPTNALPLRAAPLSTTVLPGLPTPFFLQEVPSVPNISTSLLPGLTSGVPGLTGSAGGGGFFGGVSDILGGLVGTIGELGGAFLGSPLAGPVLNRLLPGPPTTPNLALPGGAPIFQNPVFDQTPPTGVFSQPQILNQLPAVLGGGPQGAAALPGTTIQPRLVQSLRLPSRVDVPKVDSAGNLTFTTFKNMGRPILFTGDIACAKRVNKVAARARRARGGR